MLNINKNDSPYKFVQLNFWYGWLLCLFSHLILNAAEICDDGNMMLRDDLSLLRERKLQKKLRIHIKWHI